CLQTIGQLGLTSLDLNYTNVTGEEFAHVEGKMKNTLQKLCLAGCKGITPAGIQAISQFPLRTLDLSRTEMRGNPFQNTNRRMQETLRVCSLRGLPMNPSN